MLTLDMPERRTLVMAATATAVGILVARYALQPRDQPPQRGWIPFIGCAIEFGKAPLTFIKQCIDEVV